MNLQGISLEQLRFWLEVHITHLGWTHPTVVEAWAELKRRCESLDTLRNASGHRPACTGIVPGMNYWAAPFDCPCPVVGKGIQSISAPCPKCGNPRVCCPHEHNLPCDDCRASRPAAPSGYAFTGEWGYPKIGQNYLACDFPIAILKEAADGPQSPRLDIDGGKRWILRKVGEGPPLPDLPGRWIRSFGDGQCDRETVCGECYRWLSYFQWQPVIHYGDACPNCGAIWTRFAWHP